MFLGEVWKGAGVKLGLHFPQIIFFSSVFPVRAVTGVDHKTAGYLFPGFSD
jgi:hypothetical protein